MIIWVTNWSKAIDKLGYRNKLKANRRLTVPIGAERRSTIPKQMLRFSIEDMIVDRT